MDDKNRNFPSEESIRKAMELAWKDHHHARDQTWKTIQIVSVLGAGLLTIDFQYKGFFPTLCAATLVIIAAWFGILITWNHRKLEKRKFIHLMNCEELLGLHRDDLIPLHPGDSSIKEKSKLVQASAVKVPDKFKILDAINPKKNNTALFILRMHIAIMLFAILIVILRYYNG
jgi:hypothetical protein